MVCRNIVVFAGKTRSKPAEKPQKRDRSSYCMCHCCEKAPSRVGNKIVRNVVNRLETRLKRRGSSVHLPSLGHMLNKSCGSRVLCSESAKALTLYAMQASLC